MSTTANTTDTSRIKVSEHAKLRYRQRVDASETFVPDAVRDLFDSAERVSAPAVDGVAWDAGDVTIVTDNDASLVITVLLRGERA